MSETYFTGKPCKYGHIAPRFMNRVCTECSRLAWRTRDKDKHREANLRWLRKMGLEPGVPRPGRGTVSATREPPPEVKAEAVRAYAAPVSLTQFVFGDPLPGRSALDQKREVQS